MKDKTLSLNFTELAYCYDALFLDNDGTCGRTEDFHSQIGCKILQENGVPDMTFEERHSMLGFGEYGIWEFLHKQGRTPSISPADFARLQTERFTEAIAKIDDPQIIIRPGISELVDAFKAAGKKVLVVSNTPRDAVVAVQKATNLSGRIDDVISFTEIHLLGLRKKPAPDAYHLAMDMSGIGRDHGIFLAVEDSKTGVKSALDADCDVMEIVYGHMNQVADPNSTFVVNDNQHLQEAVMQRPPVYDEPHAQTMRRALG